MFNAQVSLTSLLFCQLGTQPSLTSPLRLGGPKDIVSSSHVSGRGLHAFGTSQAHGLHVRQLPSHAAGCHWLGPHLPSHADGCHQRSPHLPSHAKGCHWPSPHLPSLATDTDLTVGPQNCFASAFNLPVDPLNCICFRPL